MKDKLIVVGAIAAVVAASVLIYKNFIKKV